MISPSDLGLPPKFRAYSPGQEGAILSIASSENRFTILDGCTGSGKSVIYFSAPLLSGLRGLFLVSTKALQSQLHRDLSSAGLYNISGHSAYPCAEVSYGDSGDMSELECSGRGQGGGECDYYPAVSESLSHRSVVTSYAHWIQIAKSGDPNRLGSFDYLVCDEAHLTHKILVDCISVTLSSSNLRSLIKATLPSHDAPIDTWRGWARKSLSLARDRISNLDQGDKAKPRLRNLISDLTRFTASPVTVPWVCELTSSGVRLTPVWGDTFAEPYLFRRIPRVVLASATITPDTVAHLGIRESESDPYDENFTSPGESGFDLIEVPSTFPVSRHPTYYIPTLPPIRVSYKMTPGERKVWINRIDSIIAGRLDRKGIIPTPSYEYARIIATESRYRDIMLTHTSATARDTITRFKASPAPSILVSPSVREGVDFPGLECSYVIIAKIPFLDSRDPLTAARKALDKGYADSVVAQSLMQMAGRGMRSASDLCEVFICDGHWIHVKKNTRLFTKWFRDTWRILPDVPPAPKLD